MGVTCLHYRGALNLCDLQAVCHCPHPERRDTSLHAVTTSCIPKASGLSQMSLGELFSPHRMPGDTWRLPSLPQGTVVHRSPDVTRTDLGVAGLVRERHTTALVLGLSSESGVCSLVEALVGTESERQT